MTLKAISISVGARTMVALFALGLLLVVMSSGWQLREETQRRAARLHQELSALPALYAGPLTLSIEQKPDEVRQLLHQIVQRHGLHSAELRTLAGAQYRAQNELTDAEVEPGPGTEFPLGEAGALRVQAPAVSMGNTLRQDPLLRSTLIHLMLVIALGLIGAAMLDRWLLRRLRRLSEEASRFDPTQPPQSLSWLEPDEHPPAELLRLEQAFVHVHTALGDELQREQSRGRQLREEVERQHQRLAQVERTLDAKRRELAQLERHDALTGASNRREFEIALRREFKRAQRDQGRLALAVLDVDDLKPYNQHHGRPAGDEVLRALARVLKEHFQRDTDLVARLGGEEFVVLLPGLDLDTAQGLLESMREQWRELAIPHGARPAARGRPREADVVTLSIGLAAYQPGHPYMSPQALMQAADEALYLAKHTGRDRLCLAS